MPLKEEYDEKIEQLTILLDAAKEEINRLQVFELKYNELIKAVNKFLDAEDNNPRPA